MVTNSAYTILGLGCISQPFISRPKNFSSSLVKNLKFRLIEMSNLWDFFAVTVDEKVAKDATPLVKFISFCHKTCNDMSISEITWGPLPFVYQWAVLKIKSSQRKTKNFGKRLDKEPTIVENLVAIPWIFWAMEHNNLMCFPKGWKIAVFVFGLNEETFKSTFQHHQILWSDIRNVSYIELHIHSSRAH